MSRRSMLKTGRLSGSNRSPTHNHLVCKQTLNHLTKMCGIFKCSSVRLRTKWLRVQFPWLARFFFFGSSDNQVGNQFCAHLPDQ